MAGRVLYLADKIIPGGLAPWLRHEAAVGSTLDVMTERLYVDHDISVSRETVRRWLHHYGITTNGMNDSDGAA